jgi:hypothetical protein
MEFYRLPFRILLCSRPEAHLGEVPGAEEIPLPVSAQTTAGALSTHRSARLYAHPFCAGTSLPPPRYPLRTRNTSMLIYV